MRDVDLMIEESDLGEGFVGQLVHEMQQRGRGDVIGLVEIGMAGES